MNRLQLMIAVALTCFCARTAASHEHASARSPVVTQQTSDGSFGGFRLQAVSPVNEKVVWASGVGATVVLTTDGGATWNVRHVVDDTAIQFRDVQGVSNKIAYVLASGPGAASRIYKTEDGGASWTLQFQAADDPNFFYDCFAFWSPRRGVTMADAINGRFPAIHTTDGRTWKPVDLPPGQTGEGAFAASGTCVATQGESRAWIVTTSSRVFASHDSGNRWAAYSAPIAGGTGTAGLFSVAFRDANHGIVAGGDFVGTTVVPNFARSRDGGKTWSLTRRSAPIAGAIFGAAYARRSGDDERDDDAPVVVATGPNGTAWTADEGDSWTSIDGLIGLWAVAFANEHAGWLVGTGGRIYKITF
jgi:photosystem II stability/assembly factor-like uncharacterized protein